MSNTWSDETRAIAETAGVANSAPRQQNAFRKTARCTRAHPSASSSLDPAAITSPSDEEWQVTLANLWLYSSYVTNAIELGSVRSGHLFTERSADPVQSCTLTYEGGVGPVLSVPYIRGETQFAATQRWFQQREPPPTLLFADPAGVVTFSGVRWAGHRGAGIELGRLTADTVILGRPRTVKDEYRFSDFTSTIDGLEEFCGFQPISDNLDDPARARAVTFTVNPPEEVHWRHKGFTYALRSWAPWSTDGREVSVQSTATLTTHRRTRALVNEHIAAQWPVRALLLLVLGSEIYWREHRILDDQFPTWMMSGGPHAPQSLQVLSRRTLRDHEQEPADHHKFIWSLFALPDVKAAGLARWLKLYEDPIFRRAIEPTVEVINGATNFLEPRLMMLSLGLDAMGHFRDGTRKRNVKLSDQILRCITASGLDLSEIGSAKGIAAAIATMNNDIKHADRPDRPDGVELSLAVDLGLLIMRFQLFDLLRLSKRIHQQALHSHDINFLLEAFRLNGLKIDESGSFVPR